MLFREFAAKYISEVVETQSKRLGKRDKLQIIETNLLPFFGHMEIEDIKRRHLNEFKAKGLKQTSKRTKKLITGKTVANWLALMHHIMTYAEECEFIEAVPRAKPPKKEEVKFDFLTKEEFYKIIGSKYDAVWRGMIAFAGVTGMRPGEIKAIAWKDVDLVNGYITIWQSAPGHLRQIFDQTKTGKGRKVKLSDVAQIVIEQLPRNGRLVFENPSEPGIVRSYDVMKRGLTKACAAAGLRRITWKTMRHTYTSLSVAAKVHVTDIQFALGHSDIQTTQRYMHRDATRDSEMVKAIDDFMVKSEAETSILKNLRDSKPLDDK